MVRNGCRRPRPSCSRPAARTRMRIQVREDGVQLDQIVREEDVRWPWHPRDCLPPIPVAYWREEIHCMKHPLLALPSIAAVVLLLLAVPGSRPVHGQLADPAQAVQFSHWSAPVNLNALTLSDGTPCPAVVNTAYNDNHPTISKD